MATPFNTGAVAIFVQTPSMGAPAFLGHAEMGPEPEFRYEYEDLMCDLGGSKHPFDALYEGQMAIVSYTLTRWNEPPLRACEIIPGGDGTLPRGFDNFTDYGTLMIAEGNAVQVWLYFPKALDSAFVRGPSGPQERGYHFVGGVLLSTRKQTGTRAKKCMMNWQMMRIPFGLAGGGIVGLPGAGNIVVAGAGGSSGMICWDEDMSAVAGIAIS